MLTELIRSHVESYTDLDKLNAKMEATLLQRNKLKEVAENWDE